MFKQSFVFAAAIARGSLFGVGGTSRTPEQEAARLKYGNRTIADAFPAIAAQHLAHYGGRPSLASPNNLICLSPKRHAWQCASCGQQFEKTVVRHVDAHGQCPLCGNFPVSTSRPKGASSKHAATKAGGTITLHIPRKSNYEHAYDVEPSLRGSSIDPMLAREWLDVRSKHDFSNETLLASPKLDGMRCLVAYSKERGTLLYISRRGTLFESCDSLSEHLLPLFKKDPTLMLDGEVFHPSMQFEALASVVRTTRKHCTPEVAARQKDLQFHAFDVMYSKHIKDNARAYFPARYNLLKTMVPVVSCKRHSLPLSSSSGFHPILHVPASRMPQSKADAYLDKAIANGYEGIMIRREKFPYGFGKRTDALMKYKKFDTEEFVVQEVLEGIGRCTGQAGSFVCFTKKGKQFNATPRSHGPVRQQLWERRADIEGQAVTVQFQGKSPDGVPRFPVAICVRGAPDGSDWF